MASRADCRIALAILMLVACAVPAHGKPKKKNPLPLPDGARTEVQIRPETVAGSPELAAVGIIGPKAVVVVDNGAMVGWEQMIAVFAAVDRAAKIGDKIAVEGLIQRGKLIELVPGTPVLVTDRIAPGVAALPGFARGGMYLARVLDGPHRGRVGIIFRECLRE